MEKMGKKELIELLAKEQDISKVDAKKWLEAVIDGIVTGLVEVGKVNIKGFANFSVEDTKERMGFNPAKGEKMVIPANRTVKCKVSNALKKDFRI